MRLGFKISLYVLFASLVVFALIRTARCYDIVYFSSFLDFISTNDFSTYFSQFNYQISSGITDWTIRTDWGLFNFLRDFFNLFSNVIGFVYWLFSNLIYAVMFLLKFIAYIFVL